MDEETKKKLLYGGGALASIVALIFIFKKSQSSGMPSNAPQYPSSSGSGSALEAAQLQSATQLTIAQMNQQVALAQISAGTTNTKTSADAAIAAAKIGEQGKIASAAIGQVGAIPNLLKAASDFVNSFRDKKTEDASVSDSPTSGSTQDPFGKSQSAVDNFWSNQDAFWQPNTDPFGATFGPPTDNPSDFSFLGTIGSGSSDWFGSAPNDFVSSSSVGSTPDFSYNPVTYGDWRGIGEGPGAGDS